MLFSTFIHHRHQPGAGRGRNGIGGGGERFHTYIVYIFEKFSFVEYNIGSTTTTYCVYIWNQMETFKGGGLCTRTHSRSHPAPPFPSLLSNFVWIVVCVYIYFYALNFILFRYGLFLIFFLFFGTDLYIIFPILHNKYI